MSIISSLEKLGLSEQEAAIFVFLAQNGPAKAPQIQAALAINKLGAYRALKRLTDSGFVSTYGDKRLQKYAAMPLQEIVGQYDKNVHDIRRAQSEFEDWSKNLAQKEEQLYKDRRIQVYEGIEGLRLWYDEWLRSDVTAIYEIGTNLYWHKLADSTETGTKITEAARRKRVEKRIPIQTIFVDNTDNPEVPPYAQSRQDHLREAKVMAMDVPFAGAISIFGNRFGFYADEGGIKRGVIIEDHTLVSMMTAIFRDLWQRGRPV